MRFAPATQRLLRDAGLQLGLLVLGVGLIGLSTLTDIRLDETVMGVGVLLSCAALMWSVLGARRGAHSERLELLREVCEADPVRTFIVDPEGEVLFRNAMARTDPTATADAVAKDLTMAAVIRPLFANPAGVVNRLHTQATQQGTGQEDLITRQGQMRLSVQHVEGCGFVWRLEQMRPTGGVGQGDSIALPMMTVSKTDTVLFMNDACRKFLGGRPKRLGDIIRDMPLTSDRIHRVATEQGHACVRVCDVAGPDGRREIFFFPVTTAQPTTLSGPEPLAVLNSLPMAVVTIGSDGIVQSANAAACLALKEDQVAGKPIAALVGGLGRDVSHWVAQAAAGHKLSKPEVLRVLNTDQDRYLEITLCQLDGMNSNSVVALINDATELKTLQAQFVQSQKMQAIGQLAGGVAHDFNNLLTAISGHCDLLLLRHDQDDEEYPDLLQIHQNANRAASLVRQLLAFSRKQNLKMEVVDLRTTLSELTHLLDRLVGEKVQLELTHDPSLGPVRADKRQLEQFLMYLVVNARDAMADGGKITIDTEAYTVTEVQERDSAAVPIGDYAKVTVCDEGIGIPPEQLSKIFEPFFTTKKTGEGTGLGLSTAYGIVKQTGGFIFAESVVGRGASFTLLFPMFDGATVATPLPPAAKPVEQVVQDTGVIMLVEDEAPVRAFASRALKMQGFTVIEADCAEMALEKLETMDTKIDMFLTDVVMPGLDGPTWVRQALKGRPDTRVVFVSGYAEDAFKEGEQAIPNAVFLPKPFSLSELTNTVKAQLHGEPA